MPGTANAQPSPPPGDRLQPTITWPELGRSLGEELMHWTLGFFLALVIVSALGGYVFVGPLEFLQNGAVMALGFVVYQRTSHAFDDLRGRALPGIRAMRPRMPGLRCFGWALLGVVAAVAGSSVISLGLTAVGVEVVEQQRIQEIMARRDPLELGYLALGALIVAPIGEEVLFRGLLFRRLCLRLGVWAGAFAGGLPKWVLFAAAYLVSSLPFAAIHMNLSGLLIYTWLGACFAWSYYKTGALRWAMLVHCLSNTITFINLVWGGQELGAG